MTELCCTTVFSSMMLERRKEWSVGRTLRSVLMMKHHCVRYRSSVCVMCFGVVECLIGTVHKYVIVMSLSIQLLISRLDVLS